VQFRLARGDAAFVNRERGSRARIIECIGTIVLMGPSNRLADIARPGLRRSVTGASAAAAAIAASTTASTAATATAAVSPSATTIKSKNWPSERSCDGP
jgi:hypothetical protein